MKKILLSAHSGGPEERYASNSLDAVRAVRGIGVDLIEFDVRVTKDNKFVTLHDSYILIQGNSVQVEDLSATKILKYSSGACLLDEMLRTIKGHAIAHVDIKTTHMEIEIVDLCESILGRHGFIITTTEDESVLKIRKARPHIQVALTLGKDTRGMSKMSELHIRLSEAFPARRVAHCQPTMLAIHYKEARLGAIRWAAHKNIPVLLWTIDSPSQIEHAWNNPNIWAFTTNYPRRALNMKPHARVGFAKTPLHFLAAKIHHTY